jgi:hypothetical protein
MMSRAPCFSRGESLKVHLLPVSDRKVPVRSFWIVVPCCKELRRAGLPPAPRGGDCRVTLARFGATGGLPVPCNGASVTQGDLPHGGAQSAGPLKQRVTPLSALSPRRYGSWRGMAKGPLSRPYPEAAPAPFAGPLGTGAGAGAAVAAKPTARSTGDSGIVTASLASPAASAVGDGGPSSDA